MPKLIWSPLIHEIDRMTADGDLVVACVSAFCTVEGLNRLLQCCDLQSLYVVARWRTCDLAMGASDLEAYPLLTKHGVPFYINRTLHSKIYQFSSGSVLCGSGNATASGLGLIDGCNTETAVVVPSLSIADEIRMKGLRDGCVRVTDEVYDDFCKRVTACDVPDVRSQDDLDAYESYRASEKFLLSDLPAMKDPREVLAVLSDLPHSWLDGDVKWRFVNDCCNYALVPGMDREAAEDNLKKSFREAPFVKAIAEEIRRCEAMRFGAVADFVHSNCRDVPVPYRRDVKECVNTLYNWLAFCFDDLAWDVPGARSQVIRVIS